MDTQLAKKETGNYDRLIQVLVLADTVGLIGFAWYFSRRDNAQQEEIRQLKSELAEIKGQITDLRTTSNSHKHSIAEHDSRLDNTEKFMTKIGDVKRLKEVTSAIEAANDDITSIHQSLATANIKVEPLPSTKRSKNRRSNDKKSKGKKNKHKPPPSSSSSSEEESSEDDGVDPYKVLDSHKSKR